MDSHFVFSKSKNKLECTSPENVTTTGIWDSKCINNEDCPFFKKNNIIRIVAVVVKMDFAKCH